MTSWASGYVADLPYTAGCYRELNPTFLHFAALAGAGVESPDPDRKLAYCELGCGQGFSANVVAAANPNIEVHAMDFNPSHIAGAKALAAEGGLSNVHFYEDSFEDFLHRTDLPAFDIMVLHGVFSWVSPVRRAEIVALIRSKLATGGLVFVSYNAMPGAGALIPLRRLMHDHAERGAGPRLARIEQAVQFAEAVRQVGQGVFATNPALGARLDQIKSQSRAYLAHDYFNRDWNPLYCSDVFDELAEAKIDFVGSAQLSERLDDIKFSAAQKALLSSVDDRNLRELLRDSILNTEFRRDIFIRGVLALPMQKRSDLWFNTRFALTVSRDKVSKSVTTNLGNVSFEQRVYEPVADALAEGPRTLKDLIAHPKVRNLGADEVRQAVYVLLAFNQIDPCLSAATDAKRAVSTKAFNTAVLSRSLLADDFHSLASPVTGGGVPVDRFTQLVLWALQRKEADIPAAVWAILKLQGSFPQKDGRMAETEEEALAQIAETTEVVKQTNIPLLKQLGIA